MADPQLTSLDQLQPDVDQHEPQHLAPQQYAPQPDAYPQQQQHQHAAPPAPAPTLYQTVVAMATSTSFLKAVAVAAAIVFAAMVFPVEDYVLRYAPFAEGMPHAAGVIKAVVAAIAIVVLRPPPLV